MNNGGNEDTRVEENEHLKMWIEGGILIIEYTPNINLDISASHIIIPDRLRFQGDKEYPVLCIFDGIKDFPIPAQDFIAKYGLSSVKAVSLVYSKCTVYSILLLFITRFARSIPTHITQNKQEAIKFLSKYI